MVRQIEERTQVHVRRGVQAVFAYSPTIFRRIRHPFEVAILPDREHIHRLRRTRDGFRWSAEPRAVVPWKDRPVVPCAFGESDQLHAAIDPEREDGDVLAIVPYDRTRIADDRTSQFRPTAANHATGAIGDRLPMPSPQRGVLG